MKQVVHAACPHDCPDACGVLITVEDGRAMKMRGDPEHPVTRGFLCAKVAKYLDRVYSPDRVLYPMRRIGSKGPVAGAPGGASHGIKRWTRLLLVWARLRGSLAARQFCLIPMAELWGRSTARPWTADFSTGWGLRSWIEPSARRPEKQD